jgi:hypothetical protein
MFHDLKLYLTKYLYLIYTLIIILLLFNQNLIGSRITGWDTHDLGFLNFLFFSDSIKNGHIPFWNHYIQSGVFFQTLNNAYLYSIFQTPFLLLSQFLNPAIVFEWMIQSYILIGGVGSYLYFKKLETSSSIAAFGTVAYTLSILTIFTGQFSFIVSLSGLPWLLYIAHSIKNDIKPIEAIVIGTLLGLYFVGGYPWLNFVNGIIFLFYSKLLIKKTRRVNINLFLVILFMTIIYILFMVPGLYNLKQNYSMFNGDFINIEPRLRSLASAPPALNTTISQAILNTIDFRLPETKTWINGVGFLVPLILIVTFISKKVSIGKYDYFWGIIGILFILYSSSVNINLYEIISKIPIFNLNRWMGLGLIFTCIALIFITVYRLEKTNYLYKEYLLKFIHLLTISNIAIFSYNISFTEAPGVREYIEKINTRVLDLNYNRNIRMMGPRDQKDYIFDNETWVIEKTPYNHGYNNLGNPWYWDFKSYDFIEEIFIITRDVKKFEPYDRKKSDTDNIYYSEYNKIIKNNFPSFSVQEKDITFENDISFYKEIKNISIKPNSAELNISVSNKALLVFSTPFKKDWNVYVNNIEAKIVKTNGFFMGVLIPERGEYNIKFTFEPILSYFTLALIYLIFLSFFIAYVLKKWREKCI